MKKIKFLTAILACSLFLTGCSMDDIIEQKGRTVYDPIPASEVTSGFYIKTSTGEYYRPTTTGQSFNGTDTKRYSPNGRYIYSVNDSKFIPKVYSDDTLIYVSSGKIPSWITAEKFTDIGYSTGAVGLVPSDGKMSLDVSRCVAGSDIKNQLQSAVGKNSLSVNSIGSQSVQNLQFSQIGTIEGADKGWELEIDGYVGTYYIKFKTKVDTRYFIAEGLYSLQNFEATKEGYMKVNREIKEGYYSIDGAGLVQFVDSPRPVEGK